jgi:hypothetical protein
LGRLKGLFPLLLCPLFIFREYRSRNPERTMALAIEAIAVEEPTVNVVGICSADLAFNDQVSYPVSKAPRPRSLGTAHGRG